jgi:N6-L-threonylcarbamoyladenine synthase
VKRAILAFESSCDETAIAAVCESGEVLFQNLSSQIETHRLYGGVVPEVASRAHFDVLDDLLQKSLVDLAESGATLVGVAATKGPGLIGPLIVGSACAEGFALGRSLPFQGIHHLRGHVASALLVPSLGGDTLQERAQNLFPAHVVLVSGGHTQILSVNERLKCRVLAETADDAAGECFDKSAKLMGLPYPGGPEIEKLALRLKEADLLRAKEFADELPRPRSEEGFSFSGLKTAIRLRLQKSPELKDDPAFAWAVQEAITDSLIRGMTRVLKSTPKGESSRDRWVFCGGVAANRHLRERLQAWAQQNCTSLHFPPIKYCTDNAAMIAAAAWVQDPSLSMKSCESRCPL